METPPANPPAPPAPAAPIPPAAPAPPAHMPPADYISLYHKAFAAYRVRALWNRREVATPSPEEALVIAEVLRVEGDRPARILAEQIEAACRATK